MSWINNFNKKYYTKLTKTVCQIPKRRTRSDTKNELKNLILESYGKGQADSISGIDTTTEQACIESIKTLINLTDKRKVETVNYTYQLGK